MAFLKFKILDQRNLEYNELEIKKLGLLYSGGNCLLSNANLFIPKESIESKIAYQQRLNSSSYKNYLSEIINSFASEVFSKSMTVIPESDADDINTRGKNIDVLAPAMDDFYIDFQDNSDFKGTPLTEFLKQSLIDAMVYGKSYIQIDFPKSEIKPLSLLQEEELGLSRAYLINVPFETIIDWSINEYTGTFNWLVIKTEEIPRNNFSDSREYKIIKYKVWEKDQKTQKVSYKIYELKLKVDKDPKPDDECTLIEEGITTFIDIPILQLQLPRELYIAGLISNLCIDHYKRYSALIHAENRSLYALPVYRQAAEVSSDGSFQELSQNPHRGEQAARQMQQRGFAVIGEKDEISFVEPDGKAYALVHQQLNELADDIRRVTHTMANAISNSKNANTTSGLSKLIDNKAKELVLTAYGEVVKAFTIKLYKLMSAARNEVVCWKILGLDEYKLTLDKDLLLKEATSVSLINIPSKTFQKVYLIQLANNLVDTVTPQEKLLIKDEICEFIDSGEHEMYEDPNEEEDEEEEKSTTKKEDK